MPSVRNPRVAAQFENVSKEPSIIDFLPSDLEPELERLTAEEFLQAYAAQFTNAGS